MTVQIPRVSTFRPEDSETDVRARLNDFQRDTAVAVEQLAERVIYKEFQALGGDTDVDVALSTTRRPVGVFLAYVEDLDAGANPSSAPSLHWAPAARGVRVKKFYGLGSSTRYRVRLRVEVE